LDAEEDVGEVGGRVDAVPLAGGDERVEAGQVLAGLVVPDMELTLWPPNQTPTTERPMMQR
jgi:hypothetical protein